MILEKAAFNEAQFSLKLIKNELQNFQAFKQKFI